MRVFIHVRVGYLQHPSPYMDENVYTWFAVPSSVVAHLVLTIITKQVKDSYWGIGFLSLNTIYNVNHHVFPLLKLLCSVMLLNLFPENYFLTTRKSKCLNYLKSLFLLMSNISYDFFQPHCLREPKKKTARVSILKQRETN